MSDEHPQALPEFIRETTRYMLNLQAEIFALRAVLQQHAGVPEKVLEDALQAAREVFAPILAQLDETPADSLADFLRGFEGPVQ